MIITCDWCKLAQPEIPPERAEFVVVGGNIDDMEIYAWYICFNHMELLTAPTDRNRWRVKGPGSPYPIDIDVYLCEFINEDAKKYYRRRPMTKWNWAYLP